jgi:hypothetical protein
MRALVNSVLNLPVQMAGDFLTSWAIGNSRTTLLTGLHVYRLLGDWFGIWYGCHRDISYLCRFVVTRTNQEHNLAFLNTWPKYVVFVSGLTTNIEPKTVRAECVIGMEGTTPPCSQERMRGNAARRTARCWTPAGRNRWAAMNSHTIPLVEVCVWWLLANKNTWYLFHGPWEHGRSWFRSSDISSTISVGR